MSYNYDQVLNNNANGYMSEIEKLKAELAQLKSETGRYQPSAPQLQTATILEYKNSDRYHILIGKYIKPILDLPMIPQMLGQFGFGSQYEALVADVQKDYLNYEKEVEQKNKMFDKTNNGEIQELKNQVAALTAKLNNIPKPQQQNQQTMIAPTQMVGQQFQQISPQANNNGMVENNG